MRRHIASVLLSALAGGGPLASCFVAIRSPGAPDAGAFTIAVRVSVGTHRDTYRSGETIRIAIANTGSSSLSYDEGPGCSPAFERLVSGQWQTHTAGERGAPCERVTVGPGGSRTVDRPLDREPQPGTYRVRLRHDAGVEYSEGFRVEP